MTFKANTVALNKAINTLITNPPVPGCEMKYSRQLKSHLLFDWEVFNFLWKWWTLGGVDEQNIKGVHPKFRGAFLQNQVFAEFLFSCSMHMVEKIDEMVEASKRQKVVGESAPVGANKLTLGPPPPYAAEQHHTLADRLVEGANPWAVGHVSEGNTDGIGDDAAVPLLVCWLY